MNRRAQRFVAPVLFTGLSAFVAFSCGGSSDTASGGFGGNACNFSPECGKSCTADSDCPTGIHCSGNMCVADCHGSDEPCPNGGTCDDRGRCPGGNGGNGGSSQSSFVGSGAASGTSTSTKSGGQGGQGGACGDITVDFKPQIPTIVLLIDQSGSMNAAFPGDVDRWHAIRDSLMDPAMGPVMALQAQVRFGLVLYSGENGTCPDLTQVMPPVKNNYTAMENVWGPAGIKNNTPTAESITTITPIISAITDPGPKLILLATDGDPDDCANPDSNGTQPPRDEAIAAVQAAFALGIKTVILAVGDQVNAQHQQDMANAGQGFPQTNGAGPACDQVNDPMCAKTYQPSDQAAMIAAFNSIIQGTRTCTFTLNGSVVSGKECSGTVEINGMAVPCNDPNGWKLDDPMTIEFTGTACDTIKNDANVKITAQFPCNAASSGSGVE